MNELLIYLLKVNIAIALFYFFYRLFFANDTFWKIRRYYLLLSVAMSFGYPLLRIESWLEKQEAVKAAIVNNYALLPEFTVTPLHKASAFNIENIMIAVYVMVFSVLLVRLLIQLFSIFKIRLQGRKHTIRQQNVIVIDKEITPFSFFGWVFVNPALHNEHETGEILTHEFTHVRQFHSVDVLVGELLSIVFWLNPATWLLKREIRQNLEFLADNKVLQSGFDCRTYQYHLLQLSYQTPDLKLTNKFNISPLKKRIIMMNQQKTSKAGLLKYSLIVPMALALIVSSNAQNIVSKAGKIITNVSTESANTNENVPALAMTTTMNDQKITTIENPVKMEVTASKQTLQDDEKVYETVEKMPEYPGGIEALMKYLIQNIKYPVVAQKAGAEGKVFVSFVVNKQGQVENAEIIKSEISSVSKLDETVVVGYGATNTETTENPNPDEPNAKTALEQEALRVVNAMAPWTPGEEKGQKVSVRYTLPLAFRLQ